MAPLLGTEPERGPRKGWGAQRLKISLAYPYLRSIPSCSSGLLKDSTCLAGTAVFCASPALFHLPYFLFLFLIFISFNFFIVWVFCLHVCLCIICVSGSLWVTEKDIKSPGTGVRDDCEPLCGCWELNLGPSGRAACGFNC